MSIGTMIRQLRRGKDLTQEQLAEYLGITARAISQWETDRTAPDLSQIPLLCNLFNVTSDTLLGIDIASKQTKIDELYNAAYEVACSGDHKKSIAMWLDAIHQYPDSYKLIGEYIDEVYMYSHMLEDKDQHIERALSFIDRVILECTDSRIRNEAIATACMWYPKIGKTEKALELASSLPDVTSSDVMLYINTGMKKHSVWQENIMGGFTHAIGDLSDYAKSTDDSGNDIFTDDEKIALCEKQIKMFKLFFEKEDYMFHSQYIEIPYRHMARIYSRNKNEEKTLFCLSEAAKYAVKFDTYDYEATQESLIARGNVPGGVWWHDGHNRSYDVLDWMETDAIFDFVRETIEFEQTINSLKNTAK